MVLLVPSVEQGAEGDVMSKWRICAQKPSNADVVELRAKMLRAKEKAGVRRLAELRRVLQGAQEELDKALGDEYISRLPEEILREIFQHVKALSGNGGRWTELYLSHVSRRWHDVVTATSSLWTNVLLDPFTLPLVPLYISRSGVHHLDLHITLLTSDIVRHFYEPAIRKELLFDLIEGRLSNVMTSLARLIPCIGRWRRLTISGDMAVERVLTELRNACALSLQHLSVKNTHLPPLDPCQLFQGGLPALTSFESLGDKPFNLSIPFLPDHLTSLVVERYTYNRFCDQVLGLPNLRYLEIRETLMMIFGTMFRTMVMPNLWHLVLTGSYSSEEAMAILRTIVAPNLEEFSIDMAFRDERFMNIELGVDHVPGQRPICASLRSLSVDLPMKNTETVFWFINVLPTSVTSLVLPHDSLLMRALLLNALQPDEYIEWPPLPLPPNKLAQPDDENLDWINDVYDDEVMESLAEIMGGLDIVWPTLKTLVLNGPHSSFYLLARLLRARSEAKAPISRVVFQCYEDEHAHEFREMAKAALDRYTEVEVEFMDE